MMSSTRFLSKISDVQRFLVIGDKEFCLKDKKVSIYKKGKYEDSFEFNSGSFYHFGQFLFSGKNFYYSIAEAEIVNMTDLEGYYFMNLSYKNLITFNGTHLLVYDFANKRILSQGPLLVDRGPWAMNERGFVCKGKKFLSFYDYLNNSHVWHHNYENLLQGIEVDTNGNLISIDDHLYIWVFDDKDSKNNATFRIDINTGQIIQEYKGFGGTLIPFNGHMIGTASNYQAAVLNTHTNEIIRYDLSDLLKPLDIQMSWTLCKFSNDGLLYFVGSSNSRYKQGSKNQIGIIDLNTQSLIWHTSIDIPEGNYNINQAVTGITVQNNLLYAHCSDYTVHIFELA